MKSRFAMLFVKIIFIVDSHSCGEQCDNRSGPSNRIFNVMGQAKFFSRKKIAKRVFSTLQKQCT